MTLGAIWRWIDRDLDRVRPLSMLLIILPFIPFALSLEFTTDQSTHDHFFLGGLCVALPWFLYVIWRGLKVLVRSFADAATYFCDRPLSPVQRRWRFVQAGAGMIIAGGLLYVFRQMN